MLCLLLAKEGIAITDWADCFSQEMEKEHIAGDRGFNCNYIEGKYLFVS